MPPARLLSIQGESLVAGEDFSSVVAARIPELKAKLQPLVRDALNVTRVAS